MAQHELMRPPPRVVVRASILFLNQSVRAVTRHLNGDILGGVTVLALLHGSYAQQSARGAEGREPNGFRPVSVQSLSRSLKSPPETMRRCVARLIELGWCQRVPAKGVIVSDAEAAQAKVETLMTEIRAAFLNMLISLKAIDFDFDLMGQAIEQDAEIDEWDSREAQFARFFPDKSNPAIDRVILEFGLRMVDGAVPHFEFDYVTSCVFGAIMSLNASAFAQDPDEAWRYGAYDTPPPDQVRRPTNLAEISQILGIPYETTRRYVNSLIARGYCVRDERKGILVPVELLQAPEAIGAGMEIVVRFVQMVADLKRLGVDFRSITRAP